MEEVIEVDDIKKLIELITDILLSVKLDGGSSGTLYGGVF